MQREKWSSQIGFVMAAAGSAIGLGTLWKFPYVTGENGGGLFVLIYILCTFLIGIPVFIAELMLGRHAQRGAVGTFATLAAPYDIWKMTGWFGVTASFLIMSFYSVVAGWGLNYALMSFNQSYKGRSAEEIGHMFDVLVQSGDITIFWHFVFTALTVVVVLPGVRQGIEYWSKWMTSSLLVILVILFINSCSLKGFSQAVHFIFSPDVSKLKPSGIIQALGLSFFTLSLGQGIMITYGSYMRKSDDIPKTALIIGVMISIISLLCALMIFPIIFSFGHAPEAGPGLVFKTLPVLFAQLPGSLLLSTIFFLLFVFTALTSAIALIEVIVANVIDLNGWPRRKAVLAVGLACFLFGIPSALSGSQGIFPHWEYLYGKSFFATVSHFVDMFLLPTGGFMVALFTGWFLDHKIAQTEFNSSTSMRWLWKPWRFLIRWVAPTAILLILLQEADIIDLDAFF